MPHPQTISAAQVIAFPPLGARSARPAPPDDTERGRILLFTGVRYERPQPETGNAGDEVVRSDRRDEIWS
jgi:hypothetical protein